MQRRTFLHLLASSACAPALAHARPKALLQRARLRVSLVLSSGSLLDRGFHDAAYRGLTRATQELGAQVSVVEGAQNTSLEARLRSVVKQRPDLVVCLGFPWSQVVRDAARAHPTQKFCVVDDEPVDPGATPANVWGVAFQEQDASYLLGVLAAGLSTTRAVGFLGGVDAPVIRRFWAGFERGVQRQDPKIRTELAFVDTTPRGFSNPAKAKSLALDLFARGVDVLFHASGASGLGVLDAAVQANRMVLGVDREFTHGPERMPATFTKRTDHAVFSAVEAVAAGKFAGGFRRLNLAQQGVDLTLHPKLVVPETLGAALQEARNQVLGGLFNPPASP